MQASHCNSMGNVMEELRTRSKKLDLRNILKASASEIKHIRYVTNLNMITAQERSWQMLFTHLNRKTQKKVSIQKSWYVGVVLILTFNLNFVSKPNDKYIYLL